MLGLIHFWTGRCSLDSAIAKTEFAQAQKDFALVIELSADPSLQPNTRALAIAKANNSQAQMFLTIYEWKLNPDQAIVDAAYFFDHALQALSEIPQDVTGFRYAAQIAPTALRVFCLSGEKDRAHFHLQWITSTSPEVSTESLLSDSHLSNEQRRECGV